MKDNCICPDHHFLDKDGYPRVKYQGKLWRFNRLIWFLSFGNIPKDMVVAHHCNNKQCVNPNHFYLTTSQINSTHAARDGLYKPRTKYSETDIALMHDLYYINKYTQQEIADVFKTHQTTISDCIRRYLRKVQDER